MGLFGGFKAKFTRNSTTKNKPQEVVCLRYHIHSEFGDEGPSIPFQLNNDIKKPEAVRNLPKKRERKALTKSVIFPPSETSQTSLSSSTPQKSLSLTNLNDEPVALPNGLQNGHTDSITISKTFTVPSNGKSVIVSDTEYRKATEEHNGVVTEKVAVVNNSHLYTTDNNVKKEEHSQTILAKASTYDDNASNTVEYMTNTEMSFLKPSWLLESSAKENGLSDSSTLIFMTQHSSRSSSFDRAMQNGEINFGEDENLFDTKKPQEITPDENFNLSFVPNKTTTDDDNDYFKVNVVKHDLNRTYSYSEDEQSHDEEEEPRFAKMGYSSQAASIFFGEGEVTEVVRPRRIQLAEDDDDDDDDRRSSGADC